MECPNCYILDEPNQRVLTLPGVSAAQFAAWKLCDVPPWVHCQHTRVCTLQAAACVFHSATLGACFEQSVHAPGGPG